MINLDQLTDPDAQRNINKVNNRESSNIARSYQRRRRYDGKAIADRFEKTGSFCALSRRRQ